MPAYKWGESWTKGMSYGQGRGDAGLWAGGGQVPLKEEDGGNNKRGQEGPQHSRGRTSMLKEEVESDLTSKLE